MAGFLDSLKEWGGSWEETQREKLTKEEVASIKSVEVELSPGCHNDEYDFDGNLQMKITMKNGKIKYAKLSTMSELEEGDTVNPKTIEVITLSREGDADIFRVDGETL